MSRNKVQENVVSDEASLPGLPGKEGKKKGGKEEREKEKDRNITGVSLFLKFCLII